MRVEAYKNVEKDGHLWEKGAVTHVSHSNFPKNP